MSRFDQGLVSRRVGDTFVFYWADSLFLGALHKTGPRHQMRETPPLLLPEELR